MMTIKKAKNILISTKDINKHKKINILNSFLRDSELIFRLNPASMAIFSFPDRKLIDVNDTALRMSGFTKNELIGKTSDDLNFYSSPKDREIFREKLLSQNRIEDYELKLRRKDGKLIDGVLSAEIFKNEGRSYILVMMMDLTSRKKSEKAQRESEEKYRTILETTEEGYYEIDLAGNFTFFNDPVCKLLGYSSSEIMGMNNRQYTDRETAKKVFQAFNKVFRTGKSTKEFDWQIIRKDGTKRYIEQSASLQRDMSGKPIGFRGIIHDITERKRMEDALRKSEENFRHSLDDSPLGVRIASAEGETLYANKAILDIYGYNNIDELKNTPLKKRYTKESYADYKIRQAKRQRGEAGPSEYEISIFRKDGEIRYVHALRKEIFWNGKKQAQIIYQDITERRQAEQTLKETLDTLRRSIRTTIQVLGIASEARDPYTAGHQRRVADLARAIAAEMNLPIDVIEGVCMAGAIHDIGKISIPSEILCKPTMLTDLEYSLVKSHCQYSYDIIKDVESPWPLADIVYQHHERSDGSGYPQKLKKDDILMESRILAVADVVEAILSYRPYRPALGLDIALAEIESNAGVLYDQNVAKACLRLFREKNFTL